MPSALQISPGGHIFFIVIGILLLVIVLITARYEYRYISFARPKPYVKGLSILSFILMTALALVCIFHIFFNLAQLVGIVGIFVVLLLIITPIQFFFRMRSFRELSFKRMDEKSKLIREVVDILDESKRKKFIESDPSMSKEKPPEGRSKEGGDKGESG